MKKLIFHLLIVPFIFFQISCNNNKTKNKTLFNVNLVDSTIVIDKSSIIGDYVIVDYDSTNYNYLGYDWRQKIIVEFNKSGEILNKLNIIGEGPQHCGLDITALGYLNAKEILVIGSKGVFTYNLKTGIIVNKIQKSGLYLQDSFCRLSILTDKGNRFVLSNTLDFSTMNALGIDKKSNYKKIRNLLLVDLNLKKFTPVIPFYKSSIYLNPKVYYPNNKICYTYDKDINMVLVTFIFDPTIYFYKLNNGSLEFVKKIEYSIDDYEQPKGWPYGVTENSLNLFKEQIKNIQIQNIYSTKLYHVIEFRKCLMKNSIDKLNSMQEISSFIGNNNVTQAGLLFISKKDGSTVEVMMPINFGTIQQINSKNQIVVIKHDSKNEIEPNKAKIFTYAIEGIK